MNREGLPAVLLAAACLLVLVASNVSADLLLYQYISIQLLGQAVKPTTTNGLLHVSRLGCSVESLSGHSRIQVVSELCHKLVFQLVKVLVRLGSSSCLSMRLKPQLLLQLLQGLPERCCLLVLL